MIGKHSCTLDDIAPYFNSVIELDQDGSAKRTLCCAIAVALHTCMAEEKDKSMTFVSAKQVFFFHFFCYFFYPNLWQSLLCKRVQCVSVTLKSSN